MSEHDGWAHLRDIEGTESDHLRGKTIVIAVSGSVAALESHRLSRSLIRHGARIQFFLTAAAATLVSPMALEWCTGSPVVTELSGRCEHLEFFGEHGKADLLLLAPATANTIGKVALGLDDNAVTTAVTTALGSKIPILCCPGMHQPMLENPAVARNLRALDEMGIELLAPKISEGKAKMMEVPEIVARVLRRLGGGDLRGKRVLLTGGPTREFLDPARCLTNPSSGASACALAEEAYRRGAEVHLVYGPGQATPAPWLPVSRVDSTEEMADAVAEQLQGEPVDILVAVAAVADFRPLKTAVEKLPTRTDGVFSLELTATPKVIDRARKLSPSTRLVAFKASSHREDDRMAEQAQRYLEAGRADLVVANSIVASGLGFESARNRYLLCSKERPPQVLGPDSKTRLAGLLWAAISEEFSR